jgi:Ras-related protein Rab-1A
MQEHDHMFKIVLVGESQSGKSCILSHFVNEKFPEQIFPTVGVDFAFKVVSVDGKLIKLQIWDTAGDKRFKTITKSYYRGTNAVIFVYDVTTKIDSLETTLKEAIAEGEDTKVKYLVGNKIDLGNRYYTTLMEEEAQKYGMKYLEISAKNLDNLKDLFNQIAGDCLSLVGEGDAE